MIFSLLLTLRDNGPHPKQLFADFFVFDDENAKQDRHVYIPHMLFQTAFIKVAYFEPNEGRRGGGVTLLHAFRFIIIIIVNR